MGINTPGQSPTEGTKKKPLLTKRMKYIIASVGTAVSMLLGGTAIKSKQEEINKKHDEINAVFTLDELPVEKLIKETICTDIYTSKYTRRLNKYIDKFGIDGGLDFLKNIPNTGSIFLTSGDIKNKNLNQIKELINKIRKEKSDALITLDFEGGYVPSFKLTKEEIIKYKFPKKLFDLRTKQYNETKTGNRENLGVFPTQLYLGNEYDNCKNEEEKIEFRNMMMNYGNALGLLFSDIGVNMIFGPVVDVVIDTKDHQKNVISRDSRAYSGTNNKNASDIISDLAISFIKGFEGTNVIVVPKHFAGLGFVLNDPHNSSAKSDPKNSATMLIWRNIIRGSKANIDIKIIDIEKQINNKETMIINKNQNINKINDEIDKIEKKNLELRKKLNVLKVDFNKHKINKKEYNKIKTKLNKDIDYNNKEIFKLVENVNEIKNTIKNIKNELKNLENKIQILNGDKQILIKPKAIMTGNVHLSIFGDQSRPVMYSKTIINILKKHDPYYATGFNYDGLLVTDDTSMESSSLYIKSKYGDKKHKEKSIVEGLRAGNNIILSSAITGDVNKIASEISKDLLINNSDNKLLIKEIRNSAKKILDLKVKLKLLSKITINGKEYYHISMPTNLSKTKVLIDSLFSNQWPGTINKDLLKLEDSNEVKEVSIIKLLRAAIKNFGSSLIRTTNYLFINDKHLVENQKNEKVLIIDKSVRQLYIYDKQSNKLLESFEIGIGSGTKLIPGLKDRRFFGDRKTPVGNYQVVQKRDAEFWRNSGREEMIKEYGGEVGGMLVLAGPWSPNIAIHGTNEEPIGEVSRGCVRTDNERINKLMQTIPLGTMVLITN